MHLIKLLLIVTIGISFGTLCLGCSSEPSQPQIVYKSLSDVPAEKLKQLQKGHFFFAHQSVGENILQGIEDIENQNSQINLKVAVMESPGKIASGTLGHTKIGENGNPKIKIDDFQSWITNGVGQNVDVAFLKLCYVDINADTNVGELFNYYQQKIEALEDQFPQIQFIHFTAPLTVSKTTWKTRLKKWMGKTDLWEYNANIKRNVYNTLLREAFQGDSIVFDIAAIESTKPDGNRVTFSLKGKTYYMMNPAYTMDGGHLNETGRQRVANALLALLANLS